jgi:aerobic-type carbon monoxide dehydrogenase small subunit (CoxS/CutS family)
MKRENTMTLRLNVNRTPVKWTVHPGDRLLDVLRANGFNGVKEGCGDGNCGACVVLVDGRPVNSCVMLAMRADGCDVMTIEGIGTPDKPHPLQESFADHGAVQCGFCTPGSILSSYALLKENPQPSDEEIKRALDGNACRCTGYVKKLAAVRDLAHSK